MDSKVNPYACVCTLCIYNIYIYVNLCIYNIYVSYKFCVCGHMRDSIDRDSAFAQYDFERNPFGIH